MAIRPISLMGPNPAQPLDIQTEQAKLAQAQQIAELLLAKSMVGESQPTFRTSAGNPFGIDVPNIQDPVGRIVDAQRARETLAGTQRQQAALAQEVQARTQAVLPQILAKRAGTPQGEVPTEGGPPTPAVPPDFMGAVQMALTSGLPETQKMGAEWAKNIPGPKDIAAIAQHHEPGSIGAYQRTLDPSLLQPPVKTETYEGAARGFQAGRPVTPSTAINTFGGPTVNALGIPVQKSEVTGREHAYPPYGDISTEKDFARLDAAAKIKMVEKGYEAYKGQQNTMQVLGQVESDLSNMPASDLGTLSWFKNNVRKLGEMFGAPHLTETSGVEGLHAVLGNLQIEKVRAFAPVTELDVKKIESIVGTEGMTKQGLTHVMDVLRDATLREMHRHETFVESAAKGSRDPTGFIQQWIPRLHEYSPTAPVVSPEPESVKALRKKYGF
jgi:hypothetical protein